jgi:hypothetical protein
MHPNVVWALVIIEAIPGGMIISTTYMTFGFLIRKSLTEWGSVSLRVA